MSRLLASSLLRNVILNAQRKSFSLNNPSNQVIAIRSMCYWDTKRPTIDLKEIELRVYKSMSTHDKIVPNQLKITSHLANDLGLDSLDTVEIIVAIEDEFDISIEDVDVEKIHTVQDIVNFIRNYYETKSNPKENPGHKYLKIQFGPQY
ncbi:hypothetical protein SSS_09987 [Sarcoptes scabiei]|uniref:Acyl carrier protein n=2 Tax=Sarcoptes scabiei TaxID=52283 RepID=A0A834VEH2_SARSC|nr:hypothetical protein SSS_09987 [Sarcoptes scabiei]